VEFLGLIDAAIGARHLGVISRAIELVGAPLGLSIDQQLRCFAYLDNRLGRLTDPDELGNAVRAMWKRWWAPLHDRLPAEVDEQEGGHLLRSSLWATARYRPQHFPGNLTLYMANGNRRHREHTEGWTGYADHIEVHSLPGHHFDIITHQVEYLAAALVKDMTRSPQAAPVR